MEIHYIREMKMEAFAKFYLDFGYIICAVVGSVSMILTFLTPYKKTFLSIATIVTIVIPVISAYNTRV